MRFEKRGAPEQKALDQVAAHGDEHVELFCNLIREESAGLVLTLVLHENVKLEQTLVRFASASGYALAGAIFARGRDMIVDFANTMCHQTGNFCVSVLIHTRTLMQSLRVYLGPTRTALASCSSEASAEKHRTDIAMRGAIH